MGGFKMGAKSGKPFKKTLSHMSRIKELMSNINLDEYGRMGVASLIEATPKDSGETSVSWDYVIERGKDRSRIIWTNSNVAGYSNIPVAILIQYGHLSKAGVFVEGQDFINPALRPIFFDLSQKIWKEVNKV